MIFLFGRSLWSEAMVNCLINLTLVENMNFHSLKRLECFNLNHKVYLDIFWQNIMKRKGNQIKVWESNGYFYSVQGDDEKKIITKKDSLEYLDIVSNKLIFSANRIAP